MRFVFRTPSNPGGNSLLLKRTVFAINGKSTPTTFIEQARSNFGCCPQKPAASSTRVVFAANTSSGQPWAAEIIEPSPEWVVRSGERASGSKTAQRCDTFRPDSPPKIGEIGDVKFRVQGLQLLYNGRLGNDTGCVFLTGTLLGGCVERESKGKPQILRGSPILRQTLLQHRGGPVFSHFNIPPTSSLELSP